jgi:TolA-binding protein
MKARVEFSLAVLAGLILFLSMSSYASPPPMSAPALMQEENSSPEDSFNHDQKAKMEKARRDEAFQKLRDGSQQLYKATGELREMIEKTNEHTFSLQILRKIDEVEKILKDVKRRAKEGI